MVPLQLKKSFFQFMFCDSLDTLNTTYMIHLQGVQMQLIKGHQIRAYTGCIQIEHPTVHSVRWKNQAFNPISLARTMGGV